MKIMIGKGVAGLAQFGERRPEILDRFGMPNRRARLDDEDSREDWQYDSLQSTFRFYDRYDGRCGWIQCENPSISIDETVLIGATLPVIVSLMQAKGFTEFDSDDYETFGTHWWQDACLELQHSYSLIRQVNLGVLWKSDDEYEWPLEC